MNKYSFLKTLFFFLSVGLCATPASSADPKEGEQRDFVQAHIERLEKSEASANAKEIGFYKDTLALLGLIDKEKARQTRVLQRIQSLPDDLQQIEKRMDLLSKEKSLAEMKTEFMKLDLAKLEDEQAAILDNMQSAQNSLSTIAGQLTNLQTLPERVQGSISRGYQQNQLVRSRLNNPEDLSDGEKFKLQIESQLLTLQQALLQQELENRTGLQELALKQRDYYSVSLHNLEVKLQLLQEIMSVKRLSDTTQQTMSPDAQALSSKNPLIRQAQTMNNQLSKQLIDSVTQTNALMKLNLKAKSWLDRGAQTEENLKEQVQMLKGSLILSRILYQVYQQLDDAPDISLNDLEEQIADLHLAQYELSQHRDRLSNKALYIKNLQLNSKQVLAEADSQYLDRLINTRITLLNQLNRQLDNQLASTINLQLTQQQVQRVYSAIEFTLQQNVFWVSSNKPIDSRWLLNWPAAVYEQVQSWMVIPDIDEWYKRLPQVAVPAGFLVLIGLLLMWKRASFSEKIKKINKDVGRFRKDSQWNSPKAIFLVMLQRLPISLFIMAAGLFFLHSNLFSRHLVVLITMNLALGQLIFSVCMQVLRPDGIAEYHFRSDKERLKILHKRLRYLWIPMLPLIILSTKGVMEPSTLGSDVIGQTLTFLLLGLPAYFLIPIAFTIVKDKASLPVSLGVLATALAPVVLIALSALGYHYTALKLAGRFIESFYLIIIWLFVYRCVLRGLSLAARRLAYRRAVAKRDLKAQAQEENENGEAFEDEPLSVEEVSQQSLRLTRMVLVIIFGVAFYWLWSDLVAIFSYLDSVTLWSKTIGSGATEQLLPTSLSDVISALALFFGALSLARNLPGLLEVLVLSKMGLSKGSGYTITTMINYILMGVSTLTALSLIGMPWEKLQWLAAGLTVGIGFGLQEVVGNFVSGIIILFEKPIRIGDTVTIGTFSGNVSKIRIRATTITDFDRKEVIIPNKLVMTERLINWSLTDTVTRLIVRVGVAYGSDLELTRKLLYKAAQESNRILKDPAPLVYFLSFGASTLDHELRFFVNEMADRNPAIDEVNRNITRLFKENNVEIAFNQMDVNIKQVAKADAGVEQILLPPPNGQKPEALDPAKG
ncbi:MAG: mechanosensitive channel MscK [Enterovibrio sp.]